MSARDGSVTFEWADGEHTFRLGIAQLEELQEKAGCGPFELMRRLTVGAWRIEEVRETLRLGLIGGGMEAVQALKLVNRYAGSGQLLVAVLPARVVIAAALTGPADEPGKKDHAAKDREAMPSPTAGSPSPPSTEPAP